MTINDAVALRTLRLMQQRDMTQYRLEQDAGILHGSMDRILQSKNKTVTLTTLYRLARGFDMTVQEFLDDDVFRRGDLELD
ncbi:MAG: helix-turn-helix transcriptional regulator [Clostridia bacterium]|nr:helix-turn-helix transcriptional regulator [Clostridia bacterium]